MDKYVNKLHLIYGYTNEVKLANDKNSSFYIVKYNTVYFLRN